MKGHVELTVYDEINFGIFLSRSFPDPVLTNIAPDEDICEYRYIFSIASSMKYLLPHIFVLIQQMFEVSGTPTCRKNLRVPHNSPCFFLRPPNPTRPSYICSKACQPRRKEIAETLYYNRRFTLTVKARHTPIFTSCARNRGRDENTSGNGSLRNFE